MADRYGEIVNFLNWLSSTYGVNSDIVRDFRKKFQEENLNIEFPPKKSGWAWSDYNWDAIYQNYIGSRINLASDIPPWEQVGMNESSFSRTYPELYKQVNNYVVEQAQNQEPVTDTSIQNIYGYSDDELAQMSSQLGITPDELKKQILQTNLGVQGAEDTGLTSWQKAQLAQADADRQAALDKAKYESDLARTQGWVNQSLQRLTAPTTTQQSQEQQAQYAAIYDKAIADMKASLSPTDFAQKYILDQVKNPYKVDTKVDPKAALEEIKGTKTYIQGELKYLENQINDLSNPLLKNEQTDNLINTYKNQLAQLDRQEAWLKSGKFAGAGMWLNKIAEQIGGSESYATAQQTLSDYMNNRLDTSTMTNEQKGMLEAAKVEAQGGYGVAPKQPELQLPSWLQGSIQGSPTSIKGKNWKEAITPSAQKFGSWIPTQQNIWGSYVQASGGNTSDLLTQMQSMLPSQYKTAGWNRAFQI